MIRDKSNSISFIWNAIEKFGNQGIQFIIGTILARILSPNDYGLIGILLIFIAVSQIFVDSGFTKALIQRNDKSRDDLSTAFTFNLSIAILLYIILWFSAPFVAEFFNEFQLIKLLHILALILIVNALFTIPNTILTINLEFKSIAAINSIAVLISGMVAIYLAYTGFGVWALVIQYLLRAIISLILFSFKSRWTFRLYFSIASFKNLFSFGSNLLVASLLNVLVNKFASVFIAKSINTTQLGFYTKGVQFPDMAIGTLGSVLDTVLLPTLAKTKDLKVLKSQMEKITKLLTIFILPVMVILIILAKPIVMILLTEKWLPVVPILQLFCISRFFTNLISVNTNLLYVLNKANLVLKQHYLKIFIRIVLIIIALPHGIIFIATAEVFSAIIHLIINMHYPGKLLSFGAKTQSLILAPYFLIGLFLSGALYFINDIFENNYLNVILVSFSGILIYYILLRVFRKQDIILINSFIPFNLKH